MVIRKDRGYEYGLISDTSLRQSAASMRGLGTRQTVRGEGMVREVRGLAIILKLISG